MLYYIYGTSHTFCFNANLLDSSGGDFSIFNLFLDKKVKIITSDGSFFIRVPTVKEFSLNDQINAVYHILGLPEEKRKHLVPFEVKSSLGSNNPC